jgi:uncharacterized protein YndB with AHSA1/START domain
MIETSHQINAVERRVGTRMLAAGEARTMTISQRFRTGIDDLWDACTNPERIPRWFLPVSGDLTVGGRFQLEGNAGGTIERCDPPKSFAATWEFGGQVSWIEVELTAEPAGWTRLELQHIAHVDDDLWAQFGPGAVGIGWDSALLGLAGHLSGDATAVDPQQAAAWQSSDDGKLFMSLSSERWREASVAAGTDEAAAKAAADRCTAAYTGAG